MTELKTLNELFEDWECFECWEPYTNQEKKLIIKILKAEAVKWVKNQRKQPIGLSTESFIKHFFNLTEDDLK